MAEDLELNSCRLCLTVTADQMAIMCFGHAVYEANNIKYPVAEVLNQHFWFNLRCESNANAFVCPPCWSKVEDFHHFYQSVQTLYESRHLPPPPIKPKDAWIDEFDYDDGQQDEMSCSEIERVDSKSPVKLEIIAEKRERRPTAIAAAAAAQAAAAKMVKPDATPRRGRPRLREAVVEVDENVEELIDDDDTGGGDNSVPGSPPGKDGDLIAQYFTLQCDLCAEPLPNLIIARNHHKQKHQQRGYMTCGCGKRFMRMSSIYEHCDFHASEAPDKCNECCLIFVNARRLAAHCLTKHSEAAVEAARALGPPSNRKSPKVKVVRPTLPAVERTARGFECDQCDLSYPMIGKLRSHQRRVHTPEEYRQFECFDCHRRFAYISLLRTHMQSHDASAYVCDVCGKSFSTAYGVIKHSVIHSTDRPFPCSYCDKAFARRAEVQSHERTHTGERPYVCEVCGMAFKQLANLSAHNSGKHLNEQKYKCTECDRTFKRQRLLNYHMDVVHTGHRPFECPTCNAKFVYPQHFKKHLRIHSGQKPYACEICGKTFNSWDNRKAHRYVHSDKKMYECALCGQGFMRKPLLLAHMKDQGHESDTIVMNRPDMRVKIESVVESVVESPVTEVQA